MCDYDYEGEVISILFPFELFSSMCPCKSVSSVNPMSNLQSSHLIQLSLFGTPSPLLETQKRKKKKKKKRKKKLIVYDLISKNNNSENNVMGLLELEEREGWISLGLRSGRKGFSLEKPKPLVGLELQYLFIHILFFMIEWIIYYYYFGLKTFIGVSLSYN